MPSRTPGDEPATAAEILGRWQAHHNGGPESPPDPQQPEETSGGTAHSPTASPPRHAAPRTTPLRPPSPWAFDQVEAGREVLDALGTPAEPAQPEPPEPDPRPAPARRDRRDAAASGRSTDVVFPPRVAVRRTLGLLLLVLLAATVGAGYLAYREPTTASLGVAGLLVVVTLTTYAVRVGSAPVHLAIRGGQLEVVRGAHREVFDLTSRFTRMEVVGTPGRRGWKVLMARFGRDPLVIDASMVDPDLFTAALERHRPGSTRA